MSAVSSSSLQILSSLSLIPTAMGQALSSATPSQLNQLVSSNSQLSEEETLFGQPSTASSSGSTDSPTTQLPDIADLNGALLSSLTPANSTAASPSTPPSSSTPASPGINLLG